MPLWNIYFFNFCHFKKMFLIITANIPGLYDVGQSKHNLSRFSGQS